MSDYWPRLGWWHISDEDWERLKAKAIEKVIKERLAKKGTPAAVFYEKVGLLVKASALARISGKLPEKFYKGGFTFLRAGEGYVVVKGPKPVPSDQHCWTWSYRKPRNLHRLSYNQRPQDVRR